MSKMKSQSKRHRLSIFIISVVLFAVSHVNGRSTHRSRRAFYQLHTPPLETPTFRRDSVESPPFSPSERLSLAYSADIFNEFGSTWLPLRSAVENVPRRKMMRLPLRDAVERRPAPDEPLDVYSEIDIDNLYDTPDWFRRQQQQPTTQDIFAHNPFLAGFRHNRPVSTIASPSVRYRDLLGHDQQFVSVSPYRSDSRYQQLLAVPRGRSLDPIFQLGQGNKNILEKYNVVHGKPQTKHMGEQNLVCYMEGKAVYRKQPLTFTPLELDASTCTHVIYAFATIDFHTYTIVPQDHEYDLVRGGYRAVTGLKRLNEDLKVLISVGGGREEGAHKFSKMVSSAANRREFIKSAVAFMNKYGFDGIDLHWQYPGSEDLGGNLKDKQNFVRLLDELSETFKQYRWIISVALPPSRFRIEDGFELLEIARTVDLINVQTYDFHNEREPNADHHAPISQREHDKGIDIFYNADYAIRFLLKKGVPRSKLTLGLPFYGRSFTLRYSNTTEPGSPIKGPGREGFYTQTPGVLAYYEICDSLQSEEWSKYRDSVGSPYIVRGDQWVGYEDKDSIKNKILYVQELGLGGVSVWSTDLDDFQGLCGEKWPLLSTVKSTLRGEASSNSIERIPVKPTGACFREGLFSDPKDCSAYYICRGGLSYHLACADGTLFNSKTGKCAPGDAEQCLPGQSILVRARLKNEKKVVCYVTNWAFYRKSEGKFVPEHLDQRLCTHIVYAFASLDPEQLIMKEFDPWADLDNNLYARITSVPDSTVLLALGGWTDSSGDKYSKLVSDGASRRRFVVSAVSFLRKHGFSGLHIDWNYPKCWQSNCKKGPASDKPNFTKLVQELRTEFNKQTPPLILAAAISGYKEVIDVAYELQPLGQSLDFMSVMTYDYHGSWEQQTGHVSPLYERPGDRYPQYNTNFTMEYLVSHGAPREKLVMGIPFYGQTFTLSRHDGDYSVGAKASGPGDAGEFSKQPGMLAYYEICHRMKNNRWQMSRDHYKTAGPYAYSRNQWVGFEDATSISDKAKYIIDRGFGGAVAWTVDLDDFANRCCLESFPLLKAINRGLGRLNDPEPIGGDCTKPPEPVTPPAPTLTTGVDTGALSSTTEMHHHHEPEMSTSKPSSTTWPSWTSSSKKPSQATTTSPWWTQSKPTMKPTTTVRTTTTRRTTTTQRPTTTTTRRTTTTTRRPMIPEHHPTTESTTIPTPAVVMPQPVADPSLPSTCEPGQYLPDPQNCNAYYRCILGELSKQYCAGGLHWNKKTLVCDWPGEAKCVESGHHSGGGDHHTDSVSTTRGTTTMRTTSKPVYQDWTTRTTSTPGPWTTTSSRPWTTTSTPSTPRECENGQYYPHDECNSFYVCVNGMMIAQKCGPGLVWSQERNQCDWKHIVRCSSKKKFTTMVWTGGMTQSMTSNKARPEGPCEGGAFAPYPGDCTQYLMCLWGKYETFACAPGLSWNTARNTCDWPDVAKCVEADEPFVQPDVDEEKPVYKPEKPVYKPEKPVIAVDPPHWTTTTTMTTPPMEPTPEMPTTTMSPLSDGYKIVCYFTNWAWYRRGIGKYTPENIDPTLCTHVVYGFAVLDYENLIVKAHDSWADFDNKFYQRVVAYKQKGLKVTLAIGGWNDSAGDKYSRLVNNPAARARFIKHVMEFLEKYGFDGLDLDWEYPKCWQVNCDKGPDSDKPAFAAFVRELRAAFDQKGYLLSAAVTPSKTVIDAGYDVKALAESLDWVAVMTYDFHGQWDKQTGHVAPLYYHPDDAVTFFNANYSLNYWISEGVPREKIIMGMPLYGQSFQLENAQNHGLNAKAPGPGRAGEFTKAAGFLAYYEICDRVKNRGWTVVQDPEHRMGPYAYKENQWVSFDDAAMIRRKSEYIRRNGLGGGMIWALDLDDFRNRCGEGVHPLLKVIREVLSKTYVMTSDEASLTPDWIDEQSTKRPEMDVFPPGSQHTTKKPAVGDPDDTMVDLPRPSERPTPSPGTDGMTDEYKMVCYFTNWAWYRQGKGKFLPSDIDPDLCTHIVYGFAVLNGDQLVIKPHDSWADFDNKFYEQVTALKSKGIKVLIAIGGWNDSAGDKYSKLVNNPSARRKFIAHVMEFIKDNNFDGLDLDWEYPKCWQVDCNKGPASDKPAFAEFVRELREAFNPRGYLLSAAVSPSRRVVDAGYDVPALSQHLDWIAVMCYDYHGQWDKKTGHVAPMYVHPEDVDVTFNTNYTIHYWMSQGADPKKIVLGMPLYGQSFSLADNSNNDLNAPTYGGGEAGEETRARGFLAYYEICHNIKHRGWEVVRDPRGRMGPYARLRDQWVSFDDVSMLEHKSQYIKAMGLGGGMVWALDLDDFKNTCDCEPYPLLRTINRVLRNYPGPQPKCSLESEAKFEGTPKPTTSKKPYQHAPPNPVTHKPVASPVASPSHDPSKPFGVSCVGRLFVADETDCTKYYLCNHGEAQMQVCPSGLFWNKDHCDWPENTECHPDHVPPVVHDDETPTTSERPIYTSEATVVTPPKPSYPGTGFKPENSGYRVVCYFTNWAWYRQGEGKYTPDDIDYSLCTHITYGFAVLDSNSLTIKPHDSWADIDNKFYERVTALRGKGVKVLIAIGGWNDSLGNKYSRLVNDAQARARFITHVVQFIEKWDFDGLDLDWEYPKCWQVDCNKGPDSDKSGFAALVRELSREFRPRGWLLSSAVSPSKAVIDAGYDVPALAEHFDWIAVMTYDFHGHWDKQTGHVAPLYYYPGDTYDYFNANFSLHYWMEQGAPASKLVMGMPLYGQSFSLADTNNRGLNAKSYGPGEAGEFTRAGGFLAYYEICDRVKSRGWLVTRDPLGRIGPYANMGNQWVSYDDISEIKRKSQLIKDLRLGGGMIWALDLDDFRGKCGCGKHPLLKMMNHELRGYPLETSVKDCT